MSGGGAEESHLGWYGDRSKIEEFLNTNLLKLSLKIDLSHPARVEGF